MSNGAYAQLGAPSRLTWTVPGATQPRLVQAVINRVPGTAATTRFAAAGRSLGVVHFGGGGGQGDSGAPGALRPVTLARHLPATASTLTATTGSGTGQLDALFVTPLLSSLATTGAGHSVALVNSVADRQRALALSLPGTGLTVATSYDTRGRLSAVEVSWSSQIIVRVPAGGFAVVLR